MGFPRPQSSSCPGWGYMSTYMLFFPGLSFPHHKIASFPARLCLQHGQPLPLAGPEGGSQALRDTAWFEHVPRCLKRESSISSIYFHNFSTAALDSPSLIFTHALFFPTTKERMPVVSSYKLMTSSSQISIFQNPSGLPFQRSAGPPCSGRTHGQVEKAVQKSCT